MVVGDDIAVGGQDEAGACGGGLGDLAEDVGAAGDGGVDGNNAVGVGGVDLGVGHDLIAVHLLDHHLGAGPGRDVHLGGYLIVLHGEVGRAAAHRAAKEGAAKGQGRELEARPLLPDLPVGGLGLAVAIVIGLAGLVVGGIGIMIGVVLVVVHKDLLRSAVIFFSYQRITAKYVEIMNQVCTNFELFGLVCFFTCSIPGRT